MANCTCSHVLFTLNTFWKYKFALINSCNGKEIKVKKWQSKTLTKKEEKIGKLMLHVSKDM